MAETKKICLMLDYDGTLVPIASRPALARLSKFQKRLLKRLASTPGILLVLVTGRSLADIRRLVELPGAILVANHGFEIGMGRKTIHPCGNNLRQPLTSLAHEIGRGLRGIPGVLIESKGFSVAVHYRLTPRKYWRTVKERILKISVSHRKRYRLQLTGGKRLWEIRPALLWNKGTAVLWVLKKFARNSLPWYFGDDRTDEDAFKALRNRGVTVSVGVRRGSAAMIALRGASDVWRFIRILTRSGLICRRQTP